MSPTGRLRPQLVRLRIMGTLPRLRPCACPQGSAKPHPAQPAVHAWLWKHGVSPTLRPGPHRPCMYWVLELAMLGWWVAHSRCPAPKPAALLPDSRQSQVACEQLLLHRSRSARSKECRLSRNTNWALSTPTLCRRPHVKIHSSTQASV